MSILHLVTKYRELCSCVVVAPLAARRIAGGPELDAWCRARAEQPGHADYSGFAIVNPSVQPLSAASHDSLKVGSIGAWVAALATHAS